MTNLPQIDPDRTDPFGLGVLAFRSSILREDCPLQAAHFEAGSWLAGWDYGQECHLVAEEAAQVKTARKGRRWRPTELIVLRSLAVRGETLVSLAARFCCSRSAIVDECERQNIDLLEPPAQSEEPT